MGQRASAKASVDWQYPSEAEMGIAVYLPKLPSIKSRRDRRPKIEKALARVQERKTMNTDEKKRSRLTKDALQDNVLITRSN